MTRIALTAALLVLGTVFVARSDEERAPFGHVTSSASRQLYLGVAHRHVVFTVPKRLRGLIERDRRLHGVMATAAWDTLRGALREAACEPDGAPGAVVSLQTFGSFGANFHPHLHVLVSA